MDAGLMTPSYRTRHTFGLFSACIFRCACPFSPIHGYPIPFVPAIDTPSYRTERARRDRSLGLFSSDAEPMGDAGMAESGAETMCYTTSRSSSLITCWSITHGWLTRC
jgi:hypothetical protein